MKSKPPFIPSGPPTISSKMVAGSAPKPVGAAAQVPKSNGSKGTSPSAVQGAGAPTPGATRFNNPTKSDPNSGSKVYPSVAKTGNLAPVKPAKPGTAPRPGSIKRTSSGS